MLLHKILRSIISPLLISILILPGVPMSVQAQKGRPVIVNADQPNVWTLEQAHYLLEQMHRRNLDLKAKSLEDLDANAINGLRFDVLRLLVEAGASYNEANGFTNKLLKQNKEFDSQRRTQLVSDRDKLRNESLQLTRDISDLQTQKAKATTQDDKDRLDAEIAAKTSLRDKVDHQISLDDDELKTLGDGSGDFKSTESQVQFDKSKLPSSIFDDAFQTTAKSLIERFNQAPSLNASMTLNNFLDLQYEIVSKQVTSLRDEVGPGERLLFLELPQTVNVSHHQADNKWAQSWWRIKGYTWREKIEGHASTSTADEKKKAESGQTSAEIESADSRAENRAPIRTGEDYNSILNTQRTEDKSIRVDAETASGSSALMFKTRFADLDKVNPMPELAEALAADEGGSKYPLKLSNRMVRAVELVPREGSLNVNDMKLQSKAGVFSVVASFLFGFGARLNVERQREQFSQFVQQELYSAAFGKGSREFGWTFMPMPGMDRLLSGVRTTYAAVVVPDNATSLVLESNGCFFPRSGYQPEDFARTRMPEWNVENRSSRNCGGGKAFVVTIPSGGLHGNNDFWVTRVAYQPVPKGGRVVVEIQGSNFSSQIGVLVNGEPLTQAIGIAQPLILDDSKARASVNAELKNSTVHGVLERVDGDGIVISFDMGTDFKGTPTITLVAPGKAVDLNWLPNIRVNGVKKTLTDSPKMFGGVPLQPKFRIDSVEVFRSNNGNLKALVHGAGFKPVPAGTDRLYINGVPFNHQAISSELIEVGPFPPPADDTLQVSLVYDNETVTSGPVANPVLPKISKVTIMSYEAATEKRPGVLVVKIEGTGFTPGLQSDQPNRVRVTVTTSTEAYLTINNPSEAEIVRLRDTNTDTVITTVITRKPPAQ